MNAQVAPPSQPVRIPSWPASRLLGRPVVHARQVARVGEVADVVFSPENRQLVGLLIGSERPEGSLLQALRRVLGADFGLRFVPIQRVISLNSDVVMIDSEPDAAPPLPDRQHFPRLSLTRGSAVVTMQGQRLGRLADVQLDAEGRRIAGYVVERESSSPAPVAAPSTVPSVMGQPAAPSTAPTRRRLRINLSLHDSHQVPRALRAWADRRRGGCQPPSDDDDAARGSC